MEKISKIILCFVSILEKHSQSNHYQELLFEIHHIRTKYVYFLFQFNFNFSFFIKPWRNRLCIWTTSQKRVDLDCNFWGSLPFKLTTIGEVWWLLQWNCTVALLCPCFMELWGIGGIQVGFFKKEARRGQHHYFQIAYRL